MNGSKRIIAVIGPTAAGKTEIGISLAQNLGGEVISVDSMQIYRWMDIGTAKPDSQMLSLVPHHLIDILDPDQSYNAGQFADDADQIITNLHQEKKTAILVGGTALYLRALIHGIIDVPDISPDVRNSVRLMASEQGVEACYKRLQDLDSKSADSLHPNDISRISRALEIILETGRSIRDFQEDHQFKPNRYQVMYVGASWERAELYDRINRRVHIMIKEGLIEETEKLLQRGYGAELPSMNSIGYKQAVSFLEGKMTKDQMIEDIQQKSRHYAKKQITWYKKDPSIHWLDRNKLSSTSVEKIATFLNSDH